MTTNCPTCSGSGDNGMHGDQQEMCEACEGTGRIEGTKEQLFDLLRWGAGLILLVLQTVLR